MSASPGTKRSGTSIRATSPLLTAKRKRSDGEEHDSEKRRKSRKSSQSKLDEDYDLDLDQGLNLAIARLDNRLLADYVAKRTKRFSPDLSLVELEDRHISGILGDKSSMLG